MDILNTRASHVKTFMGCEKKYELQYLKGVKQPPKKALFIGNVYDAACTKAGELVMLQDSRPMHIQLDECIAAAKESYSEQIAAFIETSGSAPYWVEPFDAMIPPILWRTAFSEMMVDMIGLHIIGVQYPLKFDHVNKVTGDVVQFTGTADVMTEFGPDDFKTTSRNPYMRKTDEEGEYIKDELGNDVKFADLSAEYRVQGGLYMRARNRELGLPDDAPSRTLFRYFVKNKTPLYVKVPLENSTELQNTLDAYLDRFIWAHEAEVFVPNMYYQWCNSCEFRSNGLCGAVQDIIQ